MGIGVESGALCARTSGGRAAPARSTPAQGRSFRTAARLLQGRACLADGRMGWLAFDTIGCETSRKYGCAGPSARFGLAL